jgi:hypothetical protein
MLIAVKCFLDALRIGRLGVASFFRRANASADKKLYRYKNFFVNEKAFACENDVLFPPTPFLVSAASLSKLPRVGLIHIGKGAEMIANVNVSLLARRHLRKNPMAALAPPLNSLWPKINPPRILYSVSQSVQWMGEYGRKANWGINKEARRESQLRNTCP